MFNRRLTVTRLGLTSLCADVRVPRMLCEGRGVDRGGNRRLFAGTPVPTPPLAPLVRWRTCAGALSITRAHGLGARAHDTHPIRVVVPPDHQIWKQPLQLMSTPVTRLPAQQFHRALKVD